LAFAYTQKVVYRREGDALLATISGPDADDQVHNVDFSYWICTQ
jgi:hypothetical protein